VEVHVAAVTEVLGVAEDHVRVARTEAMQRLEFGERLALAVRIDGRVVRLRIALVVGLRRGQVERQRDGAGVAVGVTGVGVADAVEEVRDADEHQAGRGRTRGSRPQASSPLHLEPFGAERVRRAREVLSRPIVERQLEVVGHAARHRNHGEDVVPGREARLLVQVLQEMVRGELLGDFRRRGLGGVVAARAGRQQRNAGQQRQVGSHQNRASRLITPTAFSYSMPPSALVETNWLCASTDSLRVSA
jgi:hypothetical protein